MERVVKQLVPIGQFDDLAQVHDADPPRDVAYGGKIVSDKQYAKLTFTLQGLEQVDDLCLDRYVQRRNRLVRDEKLWSKREGPSYSDSLLLATTQLYRPATCSLTRQANLSQQVCHTRLHVL
jgi:hypothetical protein